MFELSKHFQLSEFKCHDGVMPPANFQTTIKPTVEFLEALRLSINIFIWSKTGKVKNVGIAITSGYRHEKYNADCGGAKDSRHVSGHAADIKPTIPYDNIFTYDVFCDLCEVVDSYFPSRPYRLGFYPSKGNGAWIHIDCAYGFGGRRWTK